MTVLDLRDQLDAFARDNGNLVLQEGVVFGEYPDIERICIHDLRPIGKERAVLWIHIAKAIRESDKADVRR